MHVRLAAQMSRTEFLLPARKDISAGIYFAAPPPDRIAGMRVRVST